jgi:kynurenine formamidase/ribulose-5-phosphate 4-epimerase/fuculose-1-phosphate aldolase
MTIIEEHLKLTEELSRYSRLCYSRGLVGAAGGNISVRVPRTELFLVTGSGISLRNVEPGNLVVMDNDGGIVEAQSGLRASKECRFHLAVYNTRRDINAVIHVHPAFATVFASVNRSIPLVTISAELKLKQGPVVPAADPGSDELCRNIAGVLKESPDTTTVLVLERHGIVTYGQNLCDAFNDAELAEDTAKIAFFSSLHYPDRTGKPGFFLPARYPYTGSSVIDLTSPLNHNIQCYPADPPFKKEWHVKFKDAGVNVSRLELGAHTGTHVDVPLHYIENGADLSGVPVEKFMGECVALDTPKKPGENITLNDLGSADIREGDIVLFRTGWEKYAGSDDFFKGEWPGFEIEAVDELINRGVKAIGGDIASADSPENISRGSPSHKKALSSGLVLFEALVNMDRVIGKRFFFMGLPLNIEGGEGSPIRAVALL